ncbi:MAG: ABC transporter ATP-binding protein [Chloroflexi bacterium]|nr:MAG: ABC transporter ATP-binding protein [Chloroflexota bacterium]TMF58832.1 MAG: ABC transporter ATP-binding protein [Chloroflexota bacterium]
MLEARHVTAHYGQAQALRDVSFEVKEGELITLVGRNGAGKSTTLRCVMGLHRQMSGTVRLGGRDLSGLAAHERARAGLGYVPDDRGIYASLTVEENLLLPPQVGPTRWPLERVFKAFPVLKERRRHPGTKLSGGEQQALSIARALRMGASVVLLDEPTEGLAPVLVQQLRDILLEAKRDGLTMLLVEQNLRFAMAVADRHYLLAEGTVVQTFANAEIAAHEHELLRHLGV